MIDSNSQLPDQIRLRTDLLLHVQDSGAFVLEDPSEGRFFRLGITEAKFVEALIQNSATRPAIQTVEDKLPGEGRSGADWIQFHRWLVQNRLVNDEADTAGGSSPLTRALTSPFYVRIPLCNPDRWLGGVQSITGWMHSGLCVRVILVLFALAMLLNLPNFGDLIASTTKVISNGQWMSFALIWLGLKLVHEFGHATACRHYGGEVEEAGVAMILFMPMAYVNVSSAWRFPSRWHRLHVSLAGCLAEIAVATLALIVWNLTDSVLIQDWAANVVLMVIASSIVFNLNPLLKFDGYYALSDFTGVDNLFQLGKQYSRYFGWRYLLGIETSVPRMPAHAGRWIKAYSIASSLYRVLVVAGLMLTAAALFQGAGILIAIIGVGVFVVFPAISLFRRLRQVAATGNLSVPRLAMRCGFILFAVLGSLCMMPANFRRTVPGIVQYDPPTVLRSSTPGIVTKVYVHDGEVVDAGDQLLEIENTNLCLKLAELKRDLALKDLEVQACQWKGEASKLQELIPERDSLSQRVEVVESQVKKLVVRAPSSGTVVARNLSSLEGRFVQQGQEIAEIGDERHKRIQISVGQREADQSDQWLNAPARVLVGGSACIDALANRIEKSASNAPPHESMLATHGGTLAAIQDVDNDANPLTLVTPRVNAFLELGPAQSTKLRSGQRVDVRLSSTFDSLASYLFTTIRESATDLFCTTRAK